VEGRPRDPRFKNYPDMSLAEWHERKGRGVTPARTS